MAVKTMNDLFMHTLKDIYYAEKLIYRSLPKMMKQATSPELKAAFEKHREETEGQIESEMGKGFRFAPASIDELAQLAPIIAQLECLALDLTPEDEWDRIAPQLLEWARDFPASVADHREVTMRDADWHELLTSACPNERLLSLLRSLKLAEHRYEYEIVDSGSKIRRHAVEHETIATCLINKDLDGAKDALSSNWINGIWRIIEQTEARSASQGK